MKELQSQLPSLTSGANELRDGAAELGEGIQAWQQKAGEAADGASE